MTAGAATLPRLGYVNLPDQRRSTGDDPERDGSRCRLCRGAQTRDDTGLCGRCAHVVDGVERLRRLRPFVVVARSAFPPFGPVVLSGDESLHVARHRAGELADAGYRVLYVENEHTRRRWPVTG